MKKTLCVFLCFVFCLSLPVITVYAESPVIEGITGGQTVGGDTLISWKAVSGAEYYTVALRYIQDSDSGPLIYDSVKTTDLSFTLKISDMKNYGAYRVCVAAFTGGKFKYSPAITFTYSDKVTNLTDKKVVCFGDSLTANGVWESLLSTRFGTPFINAGVGGTTTETSKSRFVTDVLAKNPDITLICFTYNDAVKMEGNAPSDRSRVSLEEYKANLTYYVTELKKIGSDVILFSPNPVIEEYFNANPLHPGDGYVEDGGINALISKYLDVMKTVADEQNVYFCDLNAAFEGEDLYSLINKDGTHPNNKGYGVYARVLGDFIENTYSEPINPPELQAVKGDIDGDGKLSAIDCVMCKSYFSGKVVPDEDRFKRADINGDGKIDALDYYVLRLMFLKGE